MVSEKAASNSQSRNDRETGAREFPAVPAETDRDKAGLEAARNPASGLSEPLSDTPEKVRKSDGRNPGAGQNPESADQSGGRGEPKK